MNISAGIVITYHNSDQKSRSTFYWSTTLKFLRLNRSGLFLFPVLLKMPVDAPFKQRTEFGLQL